MRALAALLLFLTLPTAAHALPCLTLKEARAQSPHGTYKYRSTSHGRCWYDAKQHARPPAKSAFVVGKSAPEKTSSPQTVDTTVKSTAIAEQPTPAQQI